MRHPALHGEGLRRDSGPVQASRQVPRNGGQGENIQLADSLSENGRALSLLTPNTAAIPNTHTHFWLQKVMSTIISTYYQFCQA